MAQSRSELLQGGMIAIEVPFVHFLSVAQTHPQYQPLPKTSSVIEDMTFTLPEKAEVGSILAAAKRTSPLIASVEYLDQYQQNLSFRIVYHDPEQQIADATVIKLRKEITQTIEKDYKAKLVGGIQ